MADERAIAAVLRAAVEVTVSEHTDWHLCVDGNHYEDGGAYGKQYAYSGACPTAKRLRAALLPERIEPWNQSSPESKSQESPTPAPPTTTAGAGTTPTASDGSPAEPADTTGGSERVGRPTLPGDDAARPLDEMEREKVLAILRRVYNQSRRPPGALREIERAIAAIPGGGAIAAGDEWVTCPGCSRDYLADELCSCDTEDGPKCLARCCEIDHPVGTWRGSAA